jgi:hypothetical protein
MEMNEEEFAKYLQTFVTDVWSLLMKVSLKPGQVSTSLFLSFSIPAIRVSCAGLSRYAVLQLS